MPVFAAGSAASCRRNPHAEILDYLSFNFEGKEGDFYAFFYMFHLARFAAVIPWLLVIFFFVYVFYALGVDYFLYALTPDAFCSEYERWTQLANDVELKCYKYQSFHSTMWNAALTAVNCSGVAEHASEYDFDHLICFKQNIVVTFGSVAVAFPLAKASYDLLVEFIGYVSHVDNYEGSGNGFIFLSFVIRVFFGISVGFCVIGMSSFEYDLGPATNRLTFMEWIMIQIIGQYINHKL